MNNYNFKKNNKKIYKKWILNKYFNYNYNNNKKRYNLLLPPPNITGDLHIGHILNFTILDIYARIKRMKGYNVCFIPCTDHASIATEIKIRKLLKKKGIYNISKKKFKKILLNWARKYNKIIIDQLKSIGCSCDWEKFQFTMDKKNYNSVIKIFIYLYKKGLIYKKNRIINWDIVAKTSISDEEIVYKKQKSYMYYIKYFTKDKSKYLVIATTRPETIFGDTAICVNPTDKRYKNIIKNKIIVPIVNRSIPIITDKNVKKNKGTGCLKITPAHSKNDFKIYKKNRNKINIINIFNNDGTLNENCKNYKGIDRLKVRGKIYKELKKFGFLIGKRKIKNKIGYSERTNSIIEKKISLEWYLKIKNFIKPTLKIINKIKILPKKKQYKYRNLLYKWIKNLKDWNISRKLIWGHKIPVYYYNNNIYINKNKNIKKIKKDKNVLDTWFSSWILPISFFYGINNKNKINNYYPIDLLVTGYDILFFWVLRMIMFSSFYINKIPFKNVYFTGIARDINNKKLSKSLGNYKNLYFLLNKYGADSLRIGVLSKNYENDFIYNDNLCRKGRNFINKIWNSFKLIIKINKNKISTKKKIEKILIIEWFNNLLNYNIYKLNILLNNYKIYESLILIKKLFKKNFCSIYLENIKKNYIINKYIKNKTLYFYKILLKILHPYVPFITEYIWNCINKNYKKDLTISSWPKIKTFNKKKIKKFNYTFNLIFFLKKIKIIKKKINIYLKKNEIKKFKKKIYTKLVYKLSNIKNIKIKNKNKNKFLFFFYKKHKFYLLKKYIYYKINKISIYNQIKFYKNYLLNIKKKLKNKNFLLNAPYNVIKLENKKKKDIKKKILNLNKSLLN